MSFSTSSCPLLHHTGWIFHGRHLCHSLSPPCPRQLIAPIPHPRSVWTHSRRQPWHHGSIRDLFRKPLHSSTAEWNLMQPSHRFNNCGKYTYTPVAYRAHWLLRNYIEHYYSSIGENRFIQIQLGPLLEKKQCSLWPLYTVPFFGFMRNISIGAEEGGTRILSFWSSYGLWHLLANCRHWSQLRLKAAPGWLQESDMD